MRDSHWFASFLSLAASLPPFTPNSAARVMLLNKLDHVAPLLKKSLMVPHFTHSRCLCDWIPLYPTYLYDNPFYSPSLSLCFNTLISLLFLKHTRHILTSKPSHWYWDAFTPDFCQAPSPLWGFTQVWPSQRGPYWISRIQYNEI